MRCFVAMSRVTGIFMVLLFSSSAFAADNNAKIKAFDMRKEWLLNQGVISSAAAPQHINNLIFQNSPYLLSHSLQPVDWMAWTTKAFELAESTQKLVYLSIGYSTCHWCHVIALESYEDQDVAQLLNEQYISIKLDRELHPEVDRKYHLALSRTMPAPGWPIQVILTPDGNILWIDSYTPKNKLLQILKVLATKWRAEPQRLKMLAADKQSILLPNGSNNIPSENSPSLRANGDVLIEEMRNVLQSELTGNGPRFLRANWLLYLLNEQPQDVELVQKQVNQLLTSPTYDFINGGMHRYAEDGQWLTPHYEKMLYDQALLIRVLNRLYLHTKNQTYLDFAYQVVEFVERWFKQSDGYGSSLSAISGGQEGGYYRYMELDNVDSTELWEVINGSVRLSQPVLPSKGSLKDIVTRRVEAKPALDGKSILAWNAMYLQAITELYLTTQDTELYQRGEHLAEVLIYSFYENDNLFRIRFNGESSIDATVEDYSWIVISLQQWYLVSNDKKYFEFLAKINVAFTHKLNRADWTFLKQDSEIQSPAASAFWALQSLVDIGVINESEQILRTLSVDSFSLGEAGLQFAISRRYSDNASFVKPFGRGKGVVRVTSNGANIRVSLNMDPNWHINANNQNSKNLIATCLLFRSGANISDIKYPEGRVKRLGVLTSPLRLYEGNVDITFKVKKETESFNEFELELQMCSDNLCLLPEKLKLLFL